MGFVSPSTTPSPQPTKAVADPLAGDLEEKHPECNQLRQIVQYLIQSVLPSFVVHATVKEHTTIHYPPSNPERRTMIYDRDLELVDRMMGISTVVSIFLLCTELDAALNPVSTEKPRSLVLLTNPW